MDTVRVRVQTYPPGKPLPTSLRGLVGTPMLPKLYAGLPVALGFSVPALAVYLTTYEGENLLLIVTTSILTLFQATKLASSRLLLGYNADPKDVPWFKQAPIYLLSGLTAEMVSGVIWTPMDVAKSRLQRGADKHTTARALLADVRRKEGLRGVFRVRRSYGRLTRILTQIH